MNIKVISPPGNLPVTVAEIKQHLRIEIDEDDQDVELKIKAVVASLDPPNGRLGRTLITQTLRFSLPGYPARTIPLPYPPLQSVSSVRYVNSSEVETTISASDYILVNDQEPAILVLKSTVSWPTDLSENDPYPFKINFVAGYGDEPEDIPEDIRLGIMMEVGDYYLQRENISLGQAIVQNEFSRQIFNNYIWWP
ncbi:MAG: hypothetical protein MUP52_09565 [Candidatus Aminicenantes bacterium]|nr:hypothetical protein [Candidatus Aminicenantes bacterium]